MQITPNSRVARFFLCTSLTNDEKDGFQIFIYHYYVLTTFNVHLFVINNFFRLLKVPLFQSRNKFGPQVPTYLSTVRKTPCQNDLKMHLRIALILLVLREVMASFRRGRFNLPPVVSSLTGLDMPPLLPAPFCFFIDPEIR